MRRNGEAIEVRCQAGVPIRFRRPARGGPGAGAGAAGAGAGGGLRARGARWYSVRAVLGYWVESGAWWRSNAARAVLAIESDPSGSTTTASTGTDQVVWRVEARPEARQDGAIGVYELVRGIDGRWSLMRTAD